MIKRSILGGAAVAALLVFTAASGPALADGLAKFEQTIKPQIPADVLKYKSAKGLGDAGFVLEDVVITPPPESTGKKSEPVQIKRVSVEDFDFAALDKKGPPNFAKIRFEGIAIDTKPAEGVDLDQLAGIKNLAADFQLDYRVDPDRQTFTLNRLELDLTGLARLELTMVLDGVNTADMTGDSNKAMDNTSLRTASLVIEDHSLLGKAVPAVAKSQGGDETALLGMLKPMAAVFRTQGPGTQAAIDAVVSFIEDYKAPKGPLRVTLNPPSKTSAAALQNASGPEEVIKALGVVVSYAGTRPMAAAPAAAPAAAKPAPTSPAPAPTGAANKPAGSGGPGAKSESNDDDDDDDDAGKKATKK